MSNGSSQTFGFFGMLWRLALAGAIVLALSAAGGYYAVVRIMEKQETTAPDLLTLPVEEAFTKASGLGFPILLEKRESTDLLQEGRVLAQRPSPGASVKEGATMRLTIATRP